MDQRTCKQCGNPIRGQERGRPRIYCTACRPRSAPTGAPSGECRWPECTTTNDRLRRGFCTKHYSRASRLGDYDQPWLTWSSTRGPHYGQAVECRWPGCGSVRIKGHGLCNLHSRRARDIDDYDQPWLIWGQPFRCIACGTEATRTRKAKYCSDGCTLIDWRRRNRKHNRAMERERVRRRRARIARTQTERFTDVAVRKAYGDDCYLCDHRIDFSIPWPHPECPTVDHIIPLSKGGTHTLENCAMTHWKCNRQKNADITGKRPTPILLPPAG